MPAVAAPDLEATIAAELAAHRPKLEQLIREQVRFALAELTRELVAAELAGRSNGNTAEHAAGRLAESPASPSKTCSACRVELPLDAFTRERRRDGLRSRCRACEAQ